MQSDQFDSDARERAPEELRARALQCQRLAAGIGDQRTANSLKELASEYEEKARLAESAR
jgi:hypothetical protein